MHVAMLRSPDRLFALIAFAVSLAFAWVFADRPVDAGIHKQGRVVMCTTANKALPWCEVQIEGDMKPISVAMTSLRSGQLIDVAMMHHRLTGRLYYSVSVISRR